MDFDGAFARIKAATGLHTQVEIAQLLGIRQSSISDAKRRQTIPDTWLVELYRLQSLSPTWIADGEGCPYLVEDASRPTVDGWIAPDADPEPPEPEPTVAELKAALEARLGDGLRVMLVDANASVTVEPGKACQSSTLLGGFQESLQQYVADKCVPISGPSAEVGTVEESPRRGTLAEILRQKMAGNGDER